MVNVKSVLDRLVDTLLPEHYSASSIGDFIDRQGSFTKGVEVTIPNVRARKLASGAYQFSDCTGEIIISREQNDFYDVGPETPGWYRVEIPSHHEVEIRLRYDAEKRETRLMDAKPV